MLFEDLLTHISNSGPIYRWFITILIGVATIKSAFSKFILNLATASVPYHCAQAIVDNETKALSDVLANYSILGNFSALDFTCSMPRFQFISNGLLLVVNGSGIDSEKCTSWTFIPEEANRWTMFIEYEMVCDRKYLADRLQTVLQIGGCVSTVLGPLGDIIGRKPHLILICYLDLACHTLLIFIKDINVQMVLMFFIGFGSQATLIGLILVTELVAEKYRSVHGNLFWILYVVGYCSSSAICYLVLNWRMQLVVVAVIIGIGYATYIPLIPESPRWLLTRGKTKQAKRTLQQMCRFSGCKDALSNFNVESNEIVETYRQQADNKGCLLSLIPRDNFCRLEYLVALGVATFNFMTVALVYFALSFQRDFITKDPYVNVVISGLLEIPAYFLAWQMADRIGRKFSTMSTLALSGIGLFVLPYISRDSSADFQVSSGVAILIKFFITVAYSVIIVYGSEVLPTNVRSCSLFFATILEGGSMVLAPELGGILSSVYAHLNYLLYGGISVLASLSLLLLPETKDKRMPNTVAEMEPIRSICRGLPSSQTEVLTTEQQTPSREDTELEKDDIVVVSKPLRQSDA